MKTGCRPSGTATPPDAALRAPLRRLLLFVGLQTVRRRAIVEPIVFFLLALASTWPLAGTLMDHLPLGMEDAATVPLFNVWTVWWNADRAAAGYSGYWNAPIFHPAENAFAFSEPMPLTVLAAPIIWATDNRVLAYNCLLILALWLNGWTAFHLLRRLHLHRMVALAGGAMMELLPLVHSWLGVLQLVPVCGILWTFLALHHFCRHPAPRAGVLLGLSFGTVFLLCAYYGLFLAIPLALSGGWLIGRRIFQRAMWTALLPGVAVGALLCLPVVLAQQQSIQTNEFAHPIDYLAELSADVVDYLVPPWPQLIKVDALTTMEGDAKFKLCPGIMKAGLAIIGVVWGLISRRRRSWTLFCLTMLSVSFAMSLGPLLQISGWRPYTLLAHNVPGFAQARNVMRFAVFVQIVVALLAAMGLEAGVTVARRYARNAVIRRLARAGIIAVGVIAAMEIFPAAQPLFKAPDYASNHAWIEWLEARTPADSIVVCIPFPLWPDVKSYEQETVWMYWQTFHRRRMLNGYSGFFPETFQNLKMPLAELAKPETLDLLCDMGVNYCIVKRDSIQGEDVRRYCRYDPRIEAVFKDDRAGMDIYRLTPERTAKR
jgi:hypothetical protein